MRPEKLIITLKSTATSRVSRTLDIIYDVCCEQEQREVYDFSVATIARLGYKRGVPKAQSLRNKTGERYRALLRSFEEKHRGKNSKVATKGEEDWIEEIQNSKHRLLARIQASELASAKRKLLEFVPPGTRIDVRDFHGAPFNEEQKLSEIERRALSYIVSDEFLNKWGFSISEYGEIVDRTGAVVLKTATVDAVRKSLSCL